MVLLTVIGIMCKEITKTMEEINKNIILLIDNTNRFKSYDLYKTYDLYEIR